MKHLFASVLVLGVTATGAWAEATDAAAVAAACAGASNLPEPVCLCMGARAMEDLTEDQRALLVAGFEGDDPRAATLRAGLTPAEMMGVAGFVTNTPTACLSAGN